jgi:hypothetical protein
VAANLSALRLVDDQAARDFAHRLYSGLLANQVGSLRLCCDEKRVHTATRGMAVSAHWPPALQPIFAF